ncbi:hypothetical protein [Ralstonia pseudosolanacearum]|uniref:hypothetical protein n=1 Tax=Ralstonia pseudosolanacearum TaxID=1310165 RepID=UPI0008562FFD|nr:hypothetical protein [Ralstonia pseudosolanacearum]AOE89677.1 hypothetical protein LBM341_01389 [Ralstonia solanacearum]NKA11946.1 hypothetical protein [Ralstonia solanacearum]NKA47099.1 hypothetical protein [Ralstonia solanacearum]UYR00918.1 hypothetical protein NQS37_11280 [Ralstonia pseudosolanacearum]UYR10353.1 hypothetical protein NQS35_08420 [Ralstonia pseudosolanacearum]
MLVKTSSRSRLKGFLIYLIAVATVLCVHAYALHLDYAAGQEPIVAQPARSA